MPAGAISLNFKDGDGAARSGRFWSASGDPAGPMTPLHVAVDGGEAEVFGRVAATPAQFTLLDRLRQSNRMIVAAGAVLTRPANTTAYTANDSISNSATAASVTPLSATVSSYADDPVRIDRITIDTNDLGLAGKSIACHLFNQDPTANSGVLAGDNAAWSNRRAGYQGRFSGSFRGLGDGAVATLIPDEGAALIVAPSAGGRQVWFQLQTLNDFTPSAASTVLTATLRGFQGVA